MLANHWVGKPAGKADGKSSILSSLSSSIGTLTGGYYLSGKKSIGFRLVLMLSEIHTLSNIVYI